MRNRLCLLACLTLLYCLTGQSRAQMVTGKNMPGFGKTFELEAGQLAKNVTVQEIAVTAGKTEGTNILWPGETAMFTFRLTNKTDAPMQAKGKVELIRYGTSVEIGDVWVPHVFKLADVGTMPFSATVPAKGFATITLSPKVPETFGGYALIFDFGAEGRAFGAALTRTLAADAGRVQYPTYALDFPWPFEMTEAVTTTFERLGVKGCRTEVGYYPTTKPDAAERMQGFLQNLDWAQKHNITVMTTIGEGGAPMPLGRPRPWLTDDNVMLQTKSDYVWLPELDDDFQKWTQELAGKHGWPNGPINAIELWNEPWEGISISGWGADVLRFRELYTRMAQGIVEARKENGVSVLIGGACSSSNTRDKLFPDGSDTFLKWLDFVSIHYQALAADPALVPEWVNRKSEYGPVRVWDTESWVANSEDRVAAVIASMRAQGQQRTAGIYEGNVYTSQVLSDRPRSGIVQTWAPAAAVAATQKFIGQRAFHEILFKNGLPWVFVFDGLPTAEGDKGKAEAAARPDDGTLVIVGDLGGVYERNRILFRDTLGLKNREMVTALQTRLAALPADAPASARKKLESDLQKAQVLTGATLTLSDGGGQFVLFDFYGNPVPAKGGKIIVPLNGLGYFLRTKGAASSFSRLKRAVATAQIEGIEPLNIAAHDLTAPISEKPTLRLTLTNVLNRPVSGSLTVRLGGLALETPPALKLAAHETKEVTVKIAGGTASPDNAYPLTLSFDGGKDGKAVHAETLHVNLIAKRTIVVDGNLDDWKGILPQTVSDTAGIGASLTEKAYLPFVGFDTNVTRGLATGYLAYDDDYFYFAAKIADNTPYEGNVRFADRDDDQYYYPEKVLYEERNGDKKQVTRREYLTWPEGVRRFSYRKNPDLPSGNGTDNLQIAFNVVPMNEKPMLSYPAGTMPRFISYMDTDYEFALNEVAAKYGGGTEIWRLTAPGVPRKHFYPRQPKAPVDGGPVTAGKLSMRREGNTRLVEAAIPWSEIPLVKRRMEAGLPIKFSFRVNDNHGSAYELAAGRSVSKDNPFAFHNDWATHWANELEFAFQK